MITVIGSLKGGSGKSTVTFNLAVWLAMADVKVQLIDADPQATLMDVGDVRMEEGFDPPLRIQDKGALTPERLAAADETLIDVGTSDMDAMRRALQLCDRVVVPVPPSQADTARLPPTTGRWPTPAGVFRYPTATPRPRCM